MSTFAPIVVTRKSSISPWDNDDVSEGLSPLRRMKAYQKQPPKRIDCAIFPVESESNKIKKIQHNFKETRKVQSRLNTPTACFETFVPSKMSIGPFARPPSFSPILKTVRPTVSDMVTLNKTRPSTFPQIESNSVHRSINRGETEANTSNAGMTLQSELVNPHRKRISVSKSCAPQRKTSKTITIAEYIADTNNNNSSNYFCEQSRNLSIDRSSNSRFNRTIMGNSSKMNCLETIQKKSYVKRSWKMRQITDYSIFDY